MAEALTFYVFGMTTAFFSFDLGQTMNFASCQVTLLQAKVAMLSGGPEKGPSHLHYVSF